MDSKKRITIEVLDKGKKAQVSVLSEEETEFWHWMCACEFLIYLVASESGIDYDGACSNLVEGSKTYLTQEPFEIIKGKERAGDGQK